MSSEPTWQVVLASVRELSSRHPTFRLDEIVREVQKRDPDRERGTIAPTVQGMTVNAGNGPSSPCGKPLHRVHRGVYELVGDRTVARRERTSAPPPVEVLSEVPAGDSAVQREAETEVVQRLASELDVALAPERIGLSDGSRVEIDAASQVPPIIAEIWAHQGAPKSAQRNKVLADALKLAFVAADTGIAYRKLLVFTDEQAARPFTAKSWYAAALRHHGIEVRVVAIPSELRARIVDAQRRQFR